MPVEYHDSPEGHASLALLNRNGMASVLLHGAHVTEWIPAGGRAALWVSSTSRFAAREPVRGGVPICFPWFGTHPSGAAGAPMHGFARLLPWTLIDTFDVESRTTVVLRLTDSEFTRASPWPHRFEADYSISLEQSSLVLRLEVTNRDRAAFCFEDMLHTYYAVKELSAVVVAGLEGLPYQDKGDAVVKRGDNPVEIRAGISRRYSGVTVAHIDEPDRRLTVTAEGSPAAVLWNPGPDTAKAMDDFDDDGWQRTLCLENGNVGSGAVHLEPGERHAMTVKLEHLTAGATLSEQSP